MGDASRAGVITTAVHVLGRSTATADQAVDGFVSLRYAGLRFWGNQEDLEWMVNELDRELSKLRRTATGADRD